MLVILLLVSIVLISFQYKPVQTWAAKKATKYLSEELNTTVDIKSLYIKPFSSVVLEGLYILDKQRDTLLSTPKLSVELSGFSIFNSIKKKRIDFKSIQLDNGAFYLKKLKDSTTNLKFVIDYFSSADTTAKPKSKPWTLNFEKISIYNFHFRYKNYLRTELVKGVNFNDIDVSHFTTTVHNMDLVNHLFKARVTGMTLKEKSGFYVKNFSSNATIDTNQVLLQGLHIQTANSNVKNYFRMRFKSFADLDDFENKVNMDAEFHTSHLSSKDIEYFTDALTKTKTTFELGVDGRIRGLVNNLRATGLTITAAQATFIKGDFHLTGLPDWDNTFLQLKFDQIATNKKDLDYLYSHFTGKPTAKVPDIVGKFGNVNFTGRFTGLQNDFVAFGTFKTKLGRLDPDINLKINKAGIPSYSGKLTASNFDAGALLDNNDLGRTSFTGNITGSGDEIKNLNVRGDAKVAYIQFKGYSYSNLVTNGTFIKKVANGKVSINDRNVKFNLNGNINLNPKLPIYNIAGNITNARLHQLKLIKDTITFTTEVNTDFSGNNLDNLNGSILLTKIRVDDPRASYVVDTVSLSAKGKGADRIIALKSDIADGSIKGSYDLATLPSYYKTIAKKYIPSLKTDITPPKPQNFDFTLNLKNMEPVTAMFMPNLKIPDQGSFVGKFNSNDKTATLNGYIKTIKLGKIVFHDFIIDESTTDDFLGLNLSLNRVDLTDSLYIKNITVTNFLKKDSLNFNVKLSDKSAINQLDLYGLVEFGRDTTAKLKILPSDVILEHQNWKIQEQVRIRLLDGKTQVENFELSNGDQKVLIDGFISDNPADKLKLTFDKFSMATLNQLTKPSGIALKGALNGDVMFSSLTKQPGVDAKLGIDSLMMNKTLVGDVKIQSDLDNDNSRANVKVNITTRGMETMNVDGAYLIGQKGADDQLDFDIKMDHTEAIIFEPFIKNLVSDIKGSLSADVKMTGPPSKPQLNGDITLNNTGLTVNYLKTPYTINDKLTVNNSLVTIDKLTLKDSKGGKGEVNGKVDLNNISNPTLDVTLKATNLLALNTTFKDNHLYYGTAYGSGTFKFSGPIDNMKIDIEASTEAGTVFNIPLNTSATAAEYDFIRYVNHNDTLQKKTTKINAFNGVTLNFDLTVDESTVVRISTDYGVLEGSGTTRNLKLNINSLGDFEMFGDFLISTGKFEFTAKDFISKNFTVNQGGTIHWTGNPSNAEINLHAIYEVRTAIGPLYSAAGVAAPSGGGKQVLVQAELILTKTLLQPNIDFDFTFPVDPSIKDDLSTYLSDNANRSQQALSIIVRRSFASGTGSNLSDQVFGTAQQAVSEFAFNKLNSFISQSNIKNFDLNIRSFTDASATFRLWNDRVLLNGNLYSTSGSNDLFNTRQSFFNTDFRQLTKDFEIQYLIRKDGNLRGKYSYRALNNTTLNTLNDQLAPQYVNGVGLIYQRDFDSFGEFLRNIFRQNRRQPKQPAAPAPTQIPTTTAPTTKPSDDTHGDDGDDSEE